MEYANPTIAQTLLISLVGFCVVFSVLVVLMAIIVAMSKLMGVAAKPVPAPVPAAPVESAPVGLVLENISEKEAAMVMAIVADEMGKDPAQLEFVSIKEVTEK